MSKQKPMRAWIDQYGRVVFARTIKELRERAGGGRVFKIYKDCASVTHGTITKHVGYGVGHRWFNEFAPVERPIGRRV